MSTAGKLKKKIHNYDPRVAKDLERRLNAKKVNRYRKVLKTLGISGNRAQEAAPVALDGLGAANNNDQSGRHQANGAESGPASRRRDDGEVQVQVAGDVRDGGAAAAGPADGRPPKRRRGPDPSLTVCKFWAKGGCSRDAECEFQHPEGEGKAAWKRPRVGHDGAPAAPGRAPTNQLERLRASGDDSRSERAKSATAAAKAAADRALAIATAEASRKGARDLLRKRTRTGQPVMKHRIAALLSKLGGEDLT